MNISQGADEPRWVKETAVAWFRELALLLRTAAHFFVRPLRFGREWSTGRELAMNPLGFVAATWPVLLPVDYGLQRLAGFTRDSDMPFIIELCRALRPYLIVFPLSILLFIVFRVGGSRRRYATTLGAVLYWVVLATVGWIVGVALAWPLGVGNWLPNLTGGLTVIWGGLVMAGIHEVRWPFCVVWFAAAFEASLYVVNVSLHWLGWS